MGVLEACMVLWKPLCHAQHPILLGQKNTMKMYFAIASLMVMALFGFEGWNFLDWFVWFFLH
jgi:hypothetical protein